MPANKAAMLLVIRRFMAIGREGGDREDCAHYAIPAPTVARTGMPVGSKPSRQNTLMP
jgi:hypothetical protein